MSGSSTEGGRSPASAGAGDEDGISSSASSGSVGERPQPHSEWGDACALCRHAKVSCSKDFPCKRCWLLSKPCRPLPAKKRGGSAAGSSRRRKRDETGRWVSTEGKKGRATVKEEHEDEAALVPHASTSQILPNLVFSRTDARPLVEIFTQAFMQLHAEGQVVREIMVPFLRTLRVMSQAAATDVTWGFADVAAKALGVSAAELEDRQDLVLETPPSGPGRTASPSRLLATVASRSEKLRGTETFRSMDEGSTGRAVYLTQFDKAGLVSRASNEPMSRYFRSAEELHSDMLTHKTAPFLLFLSLICPEDRARWAYMLLATHVTRQQAKVTDFIKAFDREGHVRLFIVETWPTPFHDSGGDAAGTVVRMTPCPKSRHVSPNPGFHRHVTYFTSSSASGEPSLEEESAAAAQTWIHSTGQACPTGSAGASSSSPGDGFPRPLAIVFGAPLPVPAGYPQPVAQFQSNLALPDVVECQRAVGGSGGVPELGAAAAAAAADECSDIVPVMDHDMLAGLFDA